MHDYTKDDALSIRHAIQTGDLALAIQLHRVISPTVQMAHMHETDERDLREFLETPLPIFSFCSDEELRELRLCMATSICLHIRPENALLTETSLTWRHPMSHKAAAQNFFKTVAIHRTVSAWLKHGLVRTAKILNSADSPYRECEAAAREYAIQELPQLPLHGCENLNTVGCRCSVVASKINGLSQSW